MNFFQSLSKRNWNPIVTDYFSLSAKKFLAAKIAFFCEIYFIPLRPKKIESGKV